MEAISTCQCDWLVGNILTPPLGTSSRKIIINIYFMGIFDKKKPVEIRKINVKHDHGVNEVKIGEPEPILVLKKHTETLEGEKPVVSYEVHKRNHDVFRFSEAEVYTMFTEIVKHFDAQQILHLLYVAHKEEHEKADRAGEFFDNLSELLDGDDFLKTILGGGKK